MKKNFAIALMVIGLMLMVLGLIFFFAGFFSYEKLYWGNWKDLFKIRHVVCSSDAIAGGCVGALIGCVVIASCRMKIGARASVVMTALVSVGSYLGCYAGATKFSMKPGPGMLQTFYCVNSSLLFLGGVLLCIGLPLLYFGNKQGMS